ncbi:MAG: bi-domain-containing oxidoreductase [Parvularculaceae bacterium]
MKIVVQNFKTGALSVADAPAPRAGSGSVLVRACASLVSAGTDRAIIALAKKNPLGKALDRPDLALKVINKARTEGVLSTYKVVQNLINEPIPLGYSLVGEATEIGSAISDISPGERIACAGLGHANHAEMVSVPRNLCVRVPERVTDEQAAYVTLGAIAMHGVRQANQQVGATVLIVGMGLIGLLSLGICRAAGLRVIGLDIDERKLDLARSLGAQAALHPEDQGLAAQVRALTRGYGVDAALLTVSSRDSGAVFDMCAKLCRDRGRVVVVGDVKMELSRRAYFEKELEILQSRSYGPGRYDPRYEEKGQDYPIGYVRWSENRNMESFLDLIADGRLNPAALTTHRFPIENAADAYELVTGRRRETSVGILLTYGGEDPKETPAVAGKCGRAGALGLGIIGAGQFAKGVLLPAIMETGGFRAVGVATAKGLSAKSVAEKYGADYAVSDAARVFEDANVNAVVIASRHDTHARFVIEALRRGKHVFVEKPLCLTEEELAAIESAAASSDGVLCVGFNRRFSPLFGALQEHFTGRGEPMAMTYRVNAGRIPLTAENAWVHDSLIGGGRIIGEGCHFIDAMSALCGARPATVQAAAVNTGRRDLSNQDIASILITFEDGSVGALHYWSNGDAAAAKERLEVFCEERIGVLDNFRKVLLTAGGKTKTISAASQQKGFPQEAAQFLEACRNGRPSIPLEDVFAVTRATFAAATALRGSPAQ